MEFRFGSFPDKFVNLFLDNISINIVTGCWEWTGVVDPSGYGKIFSDGAICGQRLVAAHRFSYMLHKGDIPTGMVIDHLCRNRKCSNPSHLECVTALENTMRGEAWPVLNSKKTHCHKGHPFSGDNLRYYIWRGRTLRRCIQCQRDKDIAKSEIRASNRARRSRVEIGHSAQEE